MVNNADMAVDVVSESATTTGMLRRVGSMRIMLKSAMGGDAIHDLEKGVKGI
jgi:hypothetical protein